MLKINSNEIENYLRGKGLRYRKRGEKAECDICPFCHGGDSADKKTFVVYLDNEGGNYKCMRGSCGVSGSFWQLVEFFGDDPKQYYESDNYTETKTRKETYRPPPRETKAVFTSEPFKLYALTPTALAYLHVRGFTDEALASVQIGCDDQGNICFAYYHKGEICFVKCRLPKVEEHKTCFAKWKGGLRVLWGLEQCDDWDTLVITFGEYDRIAARQARVNNVVSVPSGDEDLDWINHCWYDLERFKEIILWIDNDKSGEKCLHTIASRVGAHRVRVVRTQFKDANEMLVDRTAAVGSEKAHDEIYEAVITASWYTATDIIRVADILEKEQDFSGYLTGFKFLNQALHGFLHGQLTVHTGDSKSGKSTALTQISATCMEQGGIVCAWSGEDDDQSYRYRMNIHVAGLRGTEMRMSKAGREYAVLRPEYKNAVNLFLGNRSYLLSKRFGVTEHVLIENFEIAFRRYGCDVFVVDNLMKMVAAKDTNQIFFRQAQIINALSDFTKEYKVHVHIATHINKSGQDAEPPTKNSVSGAKEITNLADNVLSWWRVPEVAKERFQGADAICSVLANRMFGDEPIANLQYDWRIKRFGERSEDLEKEYFRI